MPRPEGQTDTRPEGQTDTRSRGTDRRPGAREEREILTDMEGGGEEADGGMSPLPRFHLLFTFCIAMDTVEPRTYLQKKLKRASVMMQ